ncbi:hypothetical protein TRIUR3_17710 [Triticum urartu]|uniref:Uncharacterized protein n=1 Tax=Triticum urartu TaxID=4572 RepID=M7Z5N4_TRIUA|nr:hypothetical protein TRIUR3_17710 [Triticum urartu]
MASRVDDEGSREEERVRGSESSGDSQQLTGGRLSQFSLLLHLVLFLHPHLSLPPTPAVGVWKPRAPLCILTGFRPPALSAHPCRTPPLPPPQEHLEVEPDVSYPLPEVKVCSSSEFI